MAWTQNHLLSFCLVSLSVFAACRTARPKGELLDASAVLPVESKEDSDFISTDTSPVGVQFWSPAQRRANASFHYLVAINNLMRGDIRQALPHLESTYNLDPNAYTGSQLVEAKFIAGDSGEAKTEAHRMTLLYPKDASLRLQYGQILMAQSDFRSAEAEFKKSILLNPKLEDGYVGLARVLIAQKRLPDAIDITRKMLKELPASGKGWPLLTRLLIISKRYAEALEPAAKTWNLQQGQPEAALMYALTLDLNGKSKDAVQLYEQLYRTDPSSPELVQRMVALYQELGDLNQALSLIDDMIARTEEDHPALIMQRAIVLSEIGRHEEASNALEDILKKYPESDRLLFMSGVALEKLNKLELAFERYLKIAEESPVKLAAGYRRVLILKQQNKADQAISLAQDLTKRNDADSVTWQILVEILSDLKKYDDARIAAEKGRSRFPDKPQLLFLRGVFEERVGRVADAELTMRSLIKKYPDHASALNFLGYILAEQGRDLDYAESLIERALELKPGDGSYMDSLGWVYFQKKQYPEALKMLKAALEASPKEGVIMEHIGDVYIQLGDLMQAFQYYDRAVSEELEDRDRRRIEQKRLDTKKKIK
jgi:tetratricopeptide (TPR) repeat protein